MFTGTLFLFAMCIANILDQFYCVYLIFFHFLLLLVSIFYVLIFIIWDPTSLTSLREKMSPGRLGVLQEGNIRKWWLSKIIPLIYSCLGKLSYENMLQDLFMVPVEPWRSENPKSILSLVQSKRKKVKTFIFSRYLVHLEMFCTNALPKWVIPCNNTSPSQICIKYQVEKFQSFFCILW